MPENMNRNLGSGLGVAYLLKSTANPAQFEWKRAGLTVLFSRQLPNSSQDFNCLIKNLRTHKPQLPSYI